MKRVRNTVTKYMAAAAFSLFVPVIAVQAQGIPEYFMGNNNTGTEFYMSFLPAWPVPGGAEHIKVYVSSPVATEVTVAVEGAGWTSTKVTVPNDVIEFDIPVHVAQPYYRTDRDIPPTDQVYPRAAVRVSSADPVIVYGLTRYQYTSDGFLALPTSAIGTDYIIASYGDVGDNGTTFGQYLPSEAAIVAAFDGTEIVFTMGGTATSKTAGGLEPGQSRAIVLNRGDVYSLASSGQGADLSGSRIVSSKPVSVISGNFCAYVPIETAACDHLVEMNTPVHTWGTEYVVTKVFGRQKNSFIKIMAKEPNTTVYRDGVQIGVIQEAGGVEGIGHLHLRAAEGAADNIVISADKPISVTQFNTGQQDDNITSDPFQMVLLSAEQYTDNVIFNTPGIKGGMAFDNNYINIVFELDDQGDIPEDLELGTYENGNLLWRSIKLYYSGDFDALSQPVGGRICGVKTIKLPSDGVYHVRSSRKFTVSLYGDSNYDSYGYPAGGLMTEVSSIDNEPPVPLFSTNDDGSISGSVSDGGSATASRLAKVDILPALSSNYTFSRSVFIPGSDNLAQWNLHVQDQSKPGKATLLFTDRAGNDTTVVVEYSPTTDIREEQDVLRSAVLPQPASEIATVSFTLTAPAAVQLELYSEIGERVAVPYSGQLGIGGHSIPVKTLHLAPGVYVYRLTAGTDIVSGRIAVAR